MKGQPVSTAAFRAGLDVFRRAKQGDFDRLTDTEYYVLKARFEDQIPLVEIGLHMHPIVTRERVRQIQTNALEKLKGTGV